MTPKSLSRCSEILSVHFPQVFAPKLTPNKLKITPKLKKKKKKLKEFQSFLVTTRQIKF